MTHIESFQNFHRRYEKTTLVHRTPFIQIHHTVSQEPPHRPSTDFIHELPSLSRPAHDKAYEELKAAVALQQQTHHVPLCTGLFVKAADEERSEVPFVTSRTYHFVSQERYVRVKDLPRVKLLPSSKLRDWFRACADTLMLCHSVGVLHRNICPGSLLLDNRGFVRLSMFGVGFDHFVDMLLDDDDMGDFVAPEVFDEAEDFDTDDDADDDVRTGRDKKAVFTAACDVYSLGATFRALIDLHQLGEGEGGDLPRDVLEAIELCCVEDPAGRPSMSRVLEMVGGELGASERLFVVKRRKRTKATERKPLSEHEKRALGKLGREEEEGEVEAKDTKKQKKPKPKKEKKPKKPKKPKRVRGRRKKFAALENFDLVLQEQQAAAPTPHLKINKSLFEIDFGSVMLEKQLSMPSFGDVTKYKAKWLDRTVEFCVTKVPPQDPERYDRLEASVSAASGLMHPNVQQFYGASVQSPRIGLVMEYGTTLGEFDRDRMQELPFERKWEILSDVARGLAYLHERRVRHLSIDFDSVMLVEESSSGETRIVGKISLLPFLAPLSEADPLSFKNAFAAPEQKRGERRDSWSAKADVFRFGMLMDGLRRNLVAPHEGLGSPTTPAPAHQTWFENLMLDCISPSPSSRPSMRKVVAGFSKRQWPLPPGFRGDSDDDVEEYVEEFKLVENDLLELQPILVAAPTTEADFPDLIDEDEDEKKKTKKDEDVSIREVTAIEDDLDQVRDTLDLDEDELWPSGEPPPPPAEAPAPKRAVDAPSIAPVKQVSYERPRHQQVGPDVEILTTKSAKAVLLGDSGVGKSSIALRFVRGQFFEYAESTIGAAFLTQEVPTPDGDSVKLDLWDTAGQERYRSLAPMYYRGAQIAVVVFDITSRESYERAKSWLKEVLRQGSGDIIVAFTGNKVDLADKREVTRKEAEEYIEPYPNVVYYEVSAKTGAHVTELFSKSAELLPEAKAAEYAEDAADYSVCLKRADVQRKSGCCGGGGGGGAVTRPPRTRRPKKPKPQPKASPVKKKVTFWQGLSNFFGFGKKKKKTNTPAAKPKKLSKAERQRKEREDARRQARAKIEKVMAEQRAGGGGTGGPIVYGNMDLKQPGLQRKEAYAVKRMIGQGGQSTVYLVSDKKSGIDYTMKRYKTSVDDKEFGLEVRALRKFVGNPFVVKFKEDFTFIDEYGEVNKFIVMEYCARGDLQKRLRRMRRKTMDVETIVRYVEQICSGLEGIHGAKYVHHDLKTANLFVTKTGDIRIGDFGFCFSCDDGDGVKVKGGTPKYMSPEQKKGVFGETHLDIWSVGIIMMEMILNKLDPRQMRDFVQFVDSLMVKSKALKGIVKACVAPLPKDRPTASQLLGRIDDVRKEEEAPVAAATEGEGVPVASVAGDDKDKDKDKGRDKDKEKDEKKDVVADPDAAPPDAPPMPGAPDAAAAAAEDVPVAAAEASEPPSPTSLSKKKSEMAEAAAAAAADATGDVSAASEVVVPPTPTSISKLKSEMAEQMFARSPPAAAAAAAAGDTDDDSEVLVPPTPTSISKKKSAEAERAFPSPET